MNLRPLGLAASALSSLGAVAAFEWTPPPRYGQPVLELAAADTLEPPTPEPIVREVDHRIASGESVGPLLRRYGAPVEAVLAAARGAYDLTRVRAGRVLHLVYHDPDPVPVAIAYAVDEDRTLSLSRDGAAWTGRLDVVTYEPHRAHKEVVVQTSLWRAAIEAGLRPADIAALAAVFEYDVDFNTEIQPGARASVLVDELWRDGAPAKLGPPHAVRFENGGKTYVAIRFQRKDGSWGYYGPDGMARKKAFLRSPLAFSNVTSGFSLARYHPILKISRPHLGVDFGAPEGTPVRAIGDGVVEVAGRQSGHGNFVKLQHSGKYASSYSHLSSIAVRPGEKVHQGDLIGKVGSTGLATGPHLHFQFWVGNDIVNPMKLDLPRSEPLPPDELTAFMTVKETLLAELDGAAGR